MLFCYTSHLLVNSCAVHYGLSQQPRNVFRSDADITGMADWVLKTTDLYTAKIARTTLLSEWEKAIQE